MNQPPFLKKGDKIKIISTARKVSPADLEASLHVFKKWGLSTVIGSSIGPEEHQFAGSDKIRAKDLQDSLDDASIRAIFCARGGYGTVRIIDTIDFSRFKENPKWIVGYSDVTVLHAHIQARFNLPSLHAVMPSIFRFDEAGLMAQESMRKALFGEALDYFVPQKSAFYRIGNAEGKVLGGNLSILYSLLGSPSDINTDHSILFIEDIDEYLYHVDRMILALKRAGKFEKLQGLIVGGMTEMNDNDTPFGQNAEEIIWSHVKDYSFPVCFHFPAGHIRDNRALLLGKTARLDVSSSEIALKFLK